jgi:hypothetical protein
MRQRSDNTAQLGVVDDVFGGIRCQDIVDGDGVKGLGNTSQIYADDSR